MGVVIRKGLKVGLFNKKKFGIYCGKLIYFFFFRYGYFFGINRKIQFKYFGKLRDGNESESGESRQGDLGLDEKSGKKK